jgi:flagellar hook-basal body complex protein FliE
MSIKGISGEADLTDVVSAVNSAEATLQLVTTLRDRMIQAYQEIIRMPI